MSVALGISYDLLGGGVSDPSVGASYSLGLPRGVKGSVSTGLAIPASRGSRDNFKITTVSLGSSARKAFGKVSLGAGVGINASWYAKTVIADEAAIRSSRGFMLGEDEVHDEDEGASAPTYVGTGNREFNRLGVKVFVGYGVWKALSLDSSLGVSAVKRQFGKMYFVLDVTVLQASWSI